MGVCNIAWVPLIKPPQPIYRYFEEEEEEEADDDWRLRSGRAPSSGLRLIQQRVHQLAPLSVDTARAAPGRDILSD